MITHSMASDTVRSCNPISPRPHSSKEAITSDQRSRPRIPLVIDFHPGLPYISNILRKYHPLLLRSEKLRLALPELPIVTFRRPPNLRNVLVLARRDPVEHSLPVIEPCQKPRCQICPLIDCDHMVTSCSTHQRYRIHCGHATCDTMNVVYLLTCSVCKLQYVGSTTNAFRSRFNNHKSMIRNINLA